MSDTDPDEVREEWHPAAKKILCDRIASSKRIDHFYRKAMFEVLARAWVSSPGRSFAAKELEGAIEAITTEASYKPDTIYQQVKRLDNELQDASADVCSGATVTISPTPYRLIIYGIAPYWWVEQEASTNVGLLLSSASDWFAGLLIKGILNFLPRNFNLVVETSNDDDDLEREKVKKLLATCRGLLFVPVLNELDSKVVRSLELFPSVLIDRFIKGVDSIPSVHHDDYTAGRLVGRLLKVNRKCPHIWFVQQKSKDRGSQPLTAVIGRLAGCLEERERGRVKVEEITAAGADEEGGERALEGVKHRLRSDHGIFATTDRLAIGCRHFLSSLPLENRPRLENVISFEGQAAGGFLDPPLASVFGNPEALGALAVRVLLKRMTTTDPPEFSHYVLQPKFLLPDGRTRKEIPVSNFLSGVDLDPREYYAKESGGTQARIVVVEDIEDIPVLTPETNG